MSITKATNQKKFPTHPPSRRKRPNGKSNSRVGATGCLFLRIPVGFLSDKGMILSLSSFGAFGAETPSKKSAGNEGEEEEVEETEEEEDETEEERDPFSCFLRITIENRVIS